MIGSTNPEEPRVTFTVATHAEATALAAELRAAHAGTDWRVSIRRPLFKGDLFRVVVG